MKQATHYIIWQSIEQGAKHATRKSHKDMERYVNKLISTDDYLKGSLKIVVGYETLKITGGLDSI